MANYKKIVWGASVMLGTAGIDYLFNDTSMKDPISSVLGCASYVVNNFSPYEIMNVLFYLGEGYGIYKVVKGLCEDNEPSQIQQLQAQVASLEQRLQQQAQPPAAPAAPAAPPATPPTTP